MDAPGGGFHMWATLAVIATAVFFYVGDRVRTEVVSVGVLAALLLLFAFKPLRDAAGNDLLAPDRLLAGFGNAALITVLALLVVSEGIVRTGALDRVARLAIRLDLGPTATLAVVLALVMIVSAFVNDTPVVVIFLPIMRAIANHVGHPPARVFMPLSFAALLGGTCTLIGTSTNLLASSALVALGQPQFTLFEFTPFGAVLALCGLGYMVAFAGRLLRDRGAAGGRTALAGGRQFIARLVVPEGSAHAGDPAVAGLFRTLPGVTVLAIHRGGDRLWPPYESVRLEPGDLLSVAASRRTLTDLATREPRLLAMPEIPRARRGAQVLAEVIVPPISRLAGSAASRVGFRHGYPCAIVGLQRRPRMKRAPMESIRLEVGDVLLVAGRHEDIESIEDDRDLVVISGTAEPLPRAHHARRAGFLFLAAVGLAATGILPIAVTAVAAAAGMVILGVLTPHQAGRALDLRIALVGAAGLALGEAMEATGAATFLAHGIIGAVGGLGVSAVLSAFFLLVAVFTNILSNNTCALLFTPIAINLARGLDVEPHVFAIAAVLAANCAFATPIGYQTNLLVMAPGNYTFADYVRFGGPLVLLVWLVFSLMAPLYFGL